MISKVQSAYRIRQASGHKMITYPAMAGQCEVLIRGVNEGEARRLAALAFGETVRIEQKFSRYLPDSLVQTINTSKGRSIPIDAETSQLLEVAGNAFQLSSGLFDITSGVLREAWTFEGKEILPDEAKIHRLLRRVGWRKVQLTAGQIRLPAGMEIDLGGIGKEYAADRVAQVLYATAQKPVLVNLGGDIRAIGLGTDDPPWDIGAEGFGRVENTALGTGELWNGAVATSGDSRRYCYVNGRKLGHILNPLTGWPIAGAPHSVTVMGDYCVEAGLLATMAILHGAAAEDFLREQNVTFHCEW